MKRFSKVLISMLLLVSMLAGYIPALDFTTTANAAASEPTYRYVAVNSLTPGKTYLIVNGAGAANTSYSALKVADGTAEGGNTTSQSVTTTASNGMIIDEFDGVENLEWTYMKGNAAGSSFPSIIPATYMFQNPATGAYLYNPVYDDGNGSKMEVTYNPLEDNYPIYTHQVFNSQEAINAFLSSTSGTASISYNTIWAKIATQTYNSTYNDNTVTMKLGNLASSSGFTDFVSTFNSYNVSGGTYEHFVFYNGAFHEKNYGKSQGATWNQFVLSDESGNSSAKSFQSYRFDVEKTGGYMYLSNVFLTKNIYARVALQYYRLVDANWGENGYYPSQRYPFCQYAPKSNGSYAYTIGNFAPNSNYYGQQYYYGWSGSSFVRSWNGSSLCNTYFYEQQEVTSATSMWKLVTSASELENGADYLLVSGDGTDSSAAIISSSAAVNTGKVASNGKYHSTVSTTDIWTLHKLGTSDDSYFYLTDSNANYLITAPTGCSLGTMNRADIGGGQAYGHHFRWKYDFTNHRLVAYIVNQNGEDLTNSKYYTNVGISSGGTVSSTGTTYLYKRVYHTHNWDAGVVTTAATCTEDGVRKYTCDGTSTVFAFLGTEYYNPVIVGSQGTNFDVEVDVKILAEGGGIKNERYGGYAKAPVFTETTVGVGDTTITGSFNLNQWYHVKWDASGGSTTIYVDGVSVGTVAATPTLYGNEAFWEWNNIYIDNLKVGTYFCDMENGLEGTNSIQGHSERVQVAEGCGATKTESIPATGHSYSTGVVTPPTCTEQGYTTKTCSVCGNIEVTDYVAALGHDFTSTVYRYNGDGTHSVKCTRCDVYGDAVACTLGSYTSNGSGENDTHSATCSVCNGTFSAVHTWEETARTGDCGTDGYVDYRCTVCGQTRRETVTASGEHSAPDDWTIVTEATCVSDGLREKKCTVCGKILESEAIPATGHNYVDTVTEATCTEQGYTTHVCSNCNDTYVDNYVDALGHDWGDWTVVTYPTISAPGEEKRVCRRCGEEETAVIPQLTQTTLAASNETTTPGGTATVTFKLTGNPGIWAQNFVIYFPKALTVESVTASTAVYSNYDMGQTSTGIIPTTNPRMLEYFNAAGIADSSKYKAIAYYTDNGNEDSHADGLIVSVTFRVPEAGKCLKHYDVNLFGVFADNGGDAVNWNGDSINPAIVYENGGIDIPEGIDACETHSFGDWTITAEPTCTSKGMKERECSVCGLIEQEEIAMLAHTWVAATCTEAGYCSVCGTVNPDAPALGHLWGEWTTVREASGISPEIQKRYCGRCSAFETRKNGDAIGTGYSEYAGDELTYKYYLTDTVTPGHEYVIVNSNTAGAAKSLTDINTSISSRDITVENDGTGLFVSPSADSYIWNTTGTEGSVMFANKSSGKFLKAYGETDTPDISLNVTSSVNPYGNSAFMFNSNGYSAKSGYYLGYRDDISVQESTGGTGAAPSGDILVVTGYTYINHYSSGTPFSLNSPFSLEFDFSFNAQNSCICLKNSSFANMLHISNSTNEINLCGNTITFDASDYLLEGTGYTLWNHCKLEVANGNVTVTLNGHSFGSVSYGSFDFAPSRGFVLHNFEKDNSDGGNTAYDNFSITVDGTHIGTMTDGIDYGNGKMSGGLENDGNSASFENATLPSNWSDGGTTTTTTYATNVFTASNDSSDKVYFYEKRPVGDVIEVYELVDTITAGETYVLVDANEAGSAKLLGSDATASSATVYSDGISYTPYVLANADREFTVVKAGNGYIFNSANNNFLSPTGITGSLTAENVLESKNGAVKVNGNTYYLYKKTQITKIDTGLASDFAVVDFGTGITVGADEVRAFRNNDTYSDRVDVSLSALVTDDAGLIKNNKFYKYNLASDKLAAANGEGVYVLDKSGVGTLSLTLGEGATLRFVPTSANYETVQTFTYQCTVDRIGAYMYADLKVIPATTIYYEDNREGFITYTNGTYPDAETGAKWEIVDSNSAINTLLGDEKVYGYSDDYTSYLMYSGNSAHKITVTSSQITSGTGWMPTAEFTFSGTGFDLISATSGATTLVTLEITNTDTGVTKRLALNNYFGYQYTPAEGDTPASWEPAANDGTIAMYQVPIVTWRGDYGNYSVKIIPTYNKIMDVAKLGYSDFYLDAVRVYNPIDVSDAGNADVKAQYQADKELVAYEANLRRLLIPKNSVTEDALISGVMFTDGNGLGRTVDTYTDYTNPGANNEIIVPTGNGVSFALDSADGTVPERILLGAKVSAGLSDGESVTVVVSCGDKSKEIVLGTATDMYYDITDAIVWNGTKTETITIYSRGIEGKDPHISLTNIKFTSGSETASLSSLNFFVSAAMEADTYKVLAEEFGVDLVYGDIDGDGTVNTVDSKLIKKQMLGLIELAGYDYEAGDIDGDGEISSKDVKLLMKMLLTD